MAGNTIMTAKNSFQKGILMDFSPENTSADSLTSALNATFVTFNGNEGSLQNDMGNGRVETAYLPEGYVPVGSCEFGDIIYVVSYNPLIDKAQIGCFPSPERNLSSDELGQEPVIITCDKFQNVTIKYYTIPPGEKNYVESTKERYETATGIKRDYDKLPTEIEYDENGFPKYSAIRVITPTGRLKTGSIKEILYKSNLNPGDQYIITYSENSDLTKVTDYETTFRKLNGLPKLLNVKVVSIEDNGKMTVLDSNVKWYDLKNNTGGNPKNYFKFISHGKDNSETEIDLDQHRSIVSSAYNIYSSKVSGKLALLIELEKISGFSCGWEALTSDREIKTQYCILNPTDTISSDTIWYNEFKDVENIKEEITNGIIWFRYDIEPNNTDDTINWSTPRIYSEQNLPHEYDIYFNYSWETNNKNINPKYSILTQSVIEDENGINVNTLTNDIRKEIIIPNQYDELNPAPLHTFGRLYKPENSDSYYLYDNYIKGYLNEPFEGKVISDLIKDPNFNDIENNWNIIYNEGQFEIENGIFKTNSPDRGEIQQILSLKPDCWYTVSFKIRGWYDNKDDEDGYNVDLYIRNPDDTLDEVINFNEQVFVDGILFKGTNENFKLNTNRNRVEWNLPYTNEEEYNSSQEWVKHSFTFKTKPVVSQQYRLHFQQYFPKKESYSEITQIKFEEIKFEEKIKITLSGNPSNSNITTIHHVIEDGKYQFANETIGNETVEVGKYLLNATRGEVLTDGYKYYNNNREIIPVTISDDVINNTFKTQVRKKLRTFVVPGNTPNINYHYKVCPAMPYGMLEEYTIDDVIQLDKLGTTNIQVKDWRYYVYSNLLTLTWGLDAYTEPGKEVSEVILEFYDNCGICAAYHANNYNSYNGTFTVNIPLDVKNQTLNNKTWEGENFVHLGKMLIGNIETDDLGKKIPVYTKIDNQSTTYKYNNEIIGYSYESHNQKKGNNIYFNDDSGTLYSNLLYLVKIIVKVENKLSTGEYVYNNKPLIFYRWLWTNNMLNDFYQKVTDFDYIQPSLNLDLNCTYNTKISDDDGLIPWETSENIDQTINLDNNLVSSYHLQNVNNSKLPNIKVTPEIYLANNYNTFKLDVDSFHDMNVSITFANDYVDNIPEQPIIKYYDKDIPGLSQILKNDKFKNKFEVSSELTSSQYAVDITINKKFDYYELNKYGKLV